VEIMAEERLAEEKIEIKVVEHSPQKIFGIALLGGLVSGLLFYLYEEMPPEKREAIKSALLKNAKSFIKKWTEA